MAKPYNLNLDSITRYGENIYDLDLEEYAPTPRILSKTKINTKTGSKIFSPRRGKLPKIKTSKSLFNIKFRRKGSKISQEVKEDIGPTTARRDKKERYAKARSMTLGSSIISHHVNIETDILCNLIIELEWDGDMKNYLIEIGDDKESLYRDKLNSENLTYEYKMREYDTKIYFAIGIVGESKFESSNIIDINFFHLYYGLYAGTLFLETHNSLPMINIRYKIRIDLIKNWLTHLRTLMFAFNNYFLKFYLIDRLDFINPTDLIIICSANGKIFELANSLLMKCLVPDHTQFLIDDTIEVKTLIKCMNVMGDRFIDEICDKFKEYIVENKSLRPLQITQKLLDILLNAFKESFQPNMRKLCFTIYQYAKQYRKRFVNYLETLIFFKWIIPSLMLSISDQLVGKKLKTIVLAIKVFQKLINTAHFDQNDLREIGDLNEFILKNRKCIDIMYDCMIFGQSHIYYGPVRNIPEKIYANLWEKIRKQSDLKDIDLGDLRNVLNDTKIKYNLRNLKI